MRHELLIFRPITCILLLSFFLAACGSRTMQMPDAPTNVEAVKTDNGMLVTWRDNSSNEEGFRIYRYEGVTPLSVSEAQTQMQVDANETEFADTQVDSGKDYTYRVQAFNELGVSSAVGVGEELDEAPPPDGQARIIVQRAGGGKGQITSDPEGIACDHVSGENCSATFDFGTEITLNPQAGEDSVFEGWEGACEGNAACTLTVSPDLADNSGNIRVTANMRQLSATLSIAKTGAGQVIDRNSDGDIIDCGDTCSVTYSTVSPVIVVLEALPSDGLSFQGWGAPCEGQTGRCRVTIDRDIELEAVFGQPTPQIASFDAAPENIEAGQEATLSWELSGAVTGVKLSAFANGETTQIEVPEGADSVKVAPRESTTYSLVAVGEGGESEPQETTVTVNDAPSITSFEAEDNTVVARTPVTLSWNISGSGVTGISLLADGRKVDRDIKVGDTSIVVRPGKTTEYTLVVESSAGTLERRVSIEVGKAPVIRNFEPAKSPIGPGKRARLTWEVRDADTLSINNDIGVVTGDNVLSNELSETTEFVLTATNAFGEVSETTTVRVDVKEIPKPKILSFGVRGKPGKEVQAVENEAIVLEWEIENQAELTDLILEFNGEVSQLDKPKTRKDLPTNVVRTTEYTLSVITPSGRDTSETITVEVVTPAAIGTFEAPAEVRAGEAVPLTWTGVRGSRATLTANGITIPVSGDDFPDGGTEVRTLLVPGTITFVLTAEGATGEPVRVERQVNVVLFGTEAEAPVITSFSADTERITAGEEVTLSWDIPNQDTLTRFTLLRDVGRNVTLDDPTRYKGAEVRPAQTTTYTLELENENGVTTSEPITITVENPDPNLTDGGLEPF